MTRKSWLFLLFAAPLAAFKSRMGKSRISAITDEIALTQDDAIAFAKHYGLEWVELRRVPGTTKEFADLTVPELKRYAAELSAARLKVLILYTSAPQPGAIFGARHVFPEDSPELPSIRIRIAAAGDRELKATLEKLQRENFQGAISLETTPDKADEAMRQLMHVVGDL